MRGIPFDIIQKKLDRKNSELANVRAMRKKLADRERQICAEIDVLQNKKVELIFLQVKKQIKTENLNISSGSILALLEVLRNNSQLMNPASFAEENNKSKVAVSNSTTEENFSTAGKSDDVDVSRVNSISAISETR